MKKIPINDFRQVTETKFDSNEMKNMIVEYFTWENKLNKKTSFAYEKVPITNGDIWEEYVKGETLSDGNCKARKKSEGPDGQEYFIKNCTGDNECKAMELAGNVPGVVKCYKIFDRRHMEGKDQSCMFVLKYEEKGILLDWLQKYHEDGTYLSKEQWFKWGA